MVRQELQRHHLKKTKVDYSRHLERPTDMMLNLDREKSDKQAGAQADTSPTVLANFKETTHLDEDAYAQHDPKTTLEGRPRQTGGGHLTSRSVDQEK
jgi:hypothetical protein